MLFTRSVVLRCSAAFALALGTATAGSVPAHAATTFELARWEMNEGPDAALMVDSSVNAIVGVPGSSVITGAGRTSTYYRFPHFTRQATVPADSRRLVLVAEPRLNPGGRDYAVKFRFRTTRSFGNLIQKGQSGAVGGYFKLQAPRGVVGCLFRGADGSRSVNSGVALNDGRWHTVKCKHTVDRVVMTIDGSKTRRAFGPTGDISNDVPLTIGGKLNCDQVVVDCDYFDGDMDRVVIKTSG